MQIPFLDMRSQYLEIQKEIDSATLKVLDSGWYILGRECESFECKFKEYLVGDQDGYVIGVNSGTDALKLSMLAAGVGFGDEVVTVANTAIPTVAAICSVGAVPVFCDVDPESWLMDHRLLEACITRKTKAIVPVHLYGAACPMAQITEIAEKHGLVVIEDVAQATGATYQGAKCGTVGHFGAFSFYPTKNLGACGDGGAIFVKTKEQKDILTKLRNYGQSGRYEVDLSKGENSRLDEMQAAILAVKLSHLDDWNCRRVRLVEAYRERIQSYGLPVEIQQEFGNTGSVHHLFVIKVESVVREELMQQLAEKGVQTLIHYPLPLYRQKAFEVFQKESKQVTEELCSSIVSLPLHPYLELKHIEFIVKSIHQVLKK